ncbi:MAG: hypothetical protein ACRD1N_08980 [Terriglobia bacterium]
MAGSILVVVEDLFFFSRIQQTAQQLGVSIEPAPPEKLLERLRQGPARAIFVDLNHRSGLALDSIRELKSEGIAVPVIGFLSHVQGDLAAAARAAGCDRVMARSAFTQKLSELLLSAEC